jgi:F0F1-type ATP synthase assembly protein I
MPSDPPERRGSPWARAGVGFSQGWTVLAELFAVIGLFAYAGYRLDRALGTRPWLFATLMVVGYAGGVLHVWIWVRNRTQGDGRDDR